MPANVFIIILFAAMLHASWNALVKREGNKTTTTILVTASAALIAALVLPFVPPPARPSWIFIAASALIHIPYFLLVARAYHAGDMGQTYPLMRGIAPLIVAFAGTQFLGEPITRGGAAGIFLICLGVLGMGLGKPRGSSARGIAYAVVNAMVIASYTLKVDGFGARERQERLAALVRWVFLFTGLPLGLWLLARERSTLARYGRDRLWRPMVGGAATLLSYSLVLWAMTVASIPVVAALRENRHPVRRGHFDPGG